MKTQIGIAGVSVLVLLAVTGCGMGPWGMAGAIISNVPYILGVADRYDSHVYKLDRYSVGEVQVIGRGVRPTAGPKLDSFFLSLRDVKFEREPFHIKEIGGASFSAQALEKDINAFVNQRARTGTVDVRDIRLAFTPQQAQLTATIIMDGRTVTAVSTGVLQPQDGTRVVYIPKTFTANNATLPVAVRQELLSRINPVVELNGMKCTPSITRVTLGNGMATLDGTMALKNLP